MSKQLADDVGFNNLVMGEENVLAATAVMKMAAEPGDKYNPLFIYGPSAVGKSHLLQAAAGQLQRLQPTWNVLMLPAAEFIEECDNAWQNRTIPEFRQNLWRLDGFLLDDVHLLENRPAALEELYHLYNRMMANSRQLIFTSRHTPAEFQSFPLPMRARLQSGLMIEMQTPKERLLRDILSHHCQLQGLRLTRRAIQFISREVRSTCDVVGLVTQIRQQFREQRISLEDIRSLVEEHATRQVSVADITNAVCEHFHVETRLVRSPSRLQALVQARQIAMYLARELTSLPLVEIGKYFGGRDHTTVLYACRKVDEELKDCVFIARAAREIREGLRA